ncbi:MAG TPA: PIN domain-containing protein [Tepidisphaeraceae bacterium]|jgi:uncharacterized protein YacL
MPIFLIILRALFILLMAGIGWNYVVDPNIPLNSRTWLSMAIALVVSVMALAIDILSPRRRKLALFAGTFIGLIVGVITAYALSFVVALLVQQFTSNADLKSGQIDSLNSFFTLLVGCVTTYFSISLILQTKDDFRFIIPYVEFRKQTRGARPLLLDTSVLIDGRIAAIAESGVFESQLIVPRFVIQELQTVADSADRLKRNRGRRGLDVLAKLQKSDKVDLIQYDAPREEGVGVDQRLVQLAKELEARVLTTDFNLNKVAQLAGIDVININELAANMKPEVLPGERMLVKIMKPGESANQGVGYLDDGTMVVVEQAKAHLDEEVEFTVTNVVQTNAGKMIFGRLGETTRGPAERPKTKAT